MSIVVRIALFSVLVAGLPASAASDFIAAFAPAAAGRDAPGELPDRLSGTGLFLAGSREVDPANLPFSPQYPLWSDGAGKRRWLYLPPGTAIDASRPDAWEFPRGTRLWKEFAYDHAVETRFIERMGDGTWRYASYVWDGTATDAYLAPAEGIARLPVAAAPDGQYDIPSRDDCRACHEGAAVPVLGVSALQLSPDRDSRVPQADQFRPDYVDLYTLVDRKLLVNLPEAMRRTPPRIAATSVDERAALGYLHANCGHCHNDAGPLAMLDLDLAQGPGGDTSGALRTLIDQPSDFRFRGLNTRVVPGQPAASVLTARMRSRDPLVQMPPIGTRIADPEGIALVEHWIQNLSINQQEARP